MEGSDGDMEGMRMGKDQLIEETEPTSHSSQHNRESYSQEKGACKSNDKRKSTDVATPRGAQDGLLLPVKIREQHRQKKMSVHKGYE